MSKTIIGELLEKHDIAEGIPALDAEIAQLDEQIAQLDEKIAGCEADEERQALEEEKASSEEKRARRVKQRLMKKDPSYKKAHRALQKKKDAGEGHKWTIQRDPETNDYFVGKKDLKASKRAKIAAKGRAK